ncbi:amino acid permease 3-like isoform X2 [Vicia villosa]|uniref:amino acid permease 3-like isoform X2 n=1 Tax=Vicia villosa TaxID=3911 RepID=UPI00273B74E2|nr:amino acid permease 3-like isoform X2 [Vicia villosa]
MASAQVLPNNSASSRKQEHLEDGKRRKHFLIYRSKIKVRYLRCLLVKRFRISKFSLQRGVLVVNAPAGTLILAIFFRCNCLHRSGGNDPCHIKGIIYMISFGILEIFLSQIPELDRQWWFFGFAAVMSFTYSIIGLGLGVSKLIENNGDIQGSLSGIDVIPSQKFWTVFAAIGNIAFGYSYFIILVEIQEKIKSPPPQSKSVKNAMLITVAVTTMFYLV